MSSPKRGDAPPTIEPAQLADSRTLAALYATAFSPDPVWSAIVPNNRLRPHVIRRSFSRDMRRGGYRHVDVVRGDDGEILAALNYASPSDSTASEARPSWRGRGRQIVQEALPRLLLMAPSARRGLMHDQAVHACRPEEPHWYLRDLVTSPSAQGGGLIRKAREAEAGISGLPLPLIDELRQVLRDKPIKEDPQHIGLEIPAIHRPAKIVRYLPYRLVKVCPLLLSHVLPNHFLSRHTARLAPGG